MRANGPTLTALSGRAPCHGNGRGQSGDMPRGTGCCDRVKSMNCKHEGMTQSDASSIHLIIPYPPYDASERLMAILQP
jgi:hypothetical protein